MLCNDNIHGSCWFVQPTISLENGRRGLEYKTPFNCIFGIIYEQKYKINSQKNTHYKMKN